MFEGLNWRGAARRSAIVILIYLALFYVLSVALPGTFSLRGSGQITSLLINAFFFFFIFTFVYAFVERSRNRRIEEARRKNAPQKPVREEGDGEESALRGRPNPNTSRKKSRRRR
jgi:cbb3-type cytochrome oxidase subunit 3